MAAYEGYTPLNMLNEDMDEAKICVKVMLMWTVCYKNNPTQIATVEMILIDLNGNKLHASVKKHLMPDYEDVLKEGNFIEVSNFGVGTYSGDYKLVDHHSKINLYRSTKILRVSAFECATNGFNVVTFDDILEWKVSMKIAFDVVGLLVSITDMKIKREKGKDSSCINFVLQDPIGKQLQCALWSNFASQLHAYVDTNQMKGDHIIVTIQNAKLKEWNGSSAFATEYGRWLQEQNDYISLIKSAMKNSHETNSNLQSIVDNGVSHFNEMFNIKRKASKLDVFYIMYGVWTSPVERCFMWIGGFRSTELIKMIQPQLKPLTVQQSEKISQLIISSFHEEEAMSLKLEKFHRSLADTLSTDSLFVPSGSTSFANYKGRMSMAMGKLEALEVLLMQADKLREITLQQLHKVLTTTQSARAMVAIHDYFSRMRALSTLWLDQQ